MSDDTAASEIHANPPGVTLRPFTEAEAAALDIAAPDVFEVRRALDGVLPYAVSRVQDMHEEAIEIHGEGNEHRCPCYIRAAKTIAPALDAIGDRDGGDNVRADVARMEAALRADPPQPDSPCWACVLDELGDELF